MSRGVNELDALTCLGDSACWSVEGQPPNEADVVMATSNWGSSWTVQDRSSIAVSMGASYGISCSSTSDCVIVGVGALTTSNGGSTWQTHSVPGELNVVSCPSASLCVAEEDVTSAVPQNESTTIATSDDGGASWQDVETVGGDVGVLGSLSCPTTTLCVSVGNGYTPSSGATVNSGSSTSWGAVERSLDGGSTWSGTEEPRASVLDGVSCAPGTMVCVAVGEIEEGPVGDTQRSAGVILHTDDGGSTWVPVPLPT